MSVKEAVFLGLLFAAAFLFRLWPVWQVHFWDETVYLQNAKVICCERSNYSELHFRPPLISLLFAGAFLLWDRDYAASVLVALTNALGPLLMYCSARMLYGRAAAWISASMLAFAPFFVSSGNSLLVDSPALTLMLLSFWVLLTAMRSNSPPRFGLAGFVCALAVLMRFTSLILLAVLPLYALATTRRLKALFFFTGGFAVAFAPYLLWSWLQFGSPLSTLGKGLLWGSSGGPPESTWYYLRNFTEIFPWISVVGVLLWFVAALLGPQSTRTKGDLQPVLSSGRRENAGRWSELRLWWWVTLVIVFFSSVPHKEMRYLIPLAGPWFLLAGRGLSVLLRGSTPVSRAMGIGFLTLSLVVTFAPSLERFRLPFIHPYISEEKQAADYLKRTASPGSVLYTNSNSPVLAYYTGFPINVAVRDDATFGETFAKTMSRDGYLVVYKNISKDPSLDRLDEHSEFRRVQEKEWRTRSAPDELHLLVVYEYRRWRDQ